MDIRPANKLIDWDRPVRSIDNPELIGIVLPVDHIPERRRVAMLHKAAYGRPDLGGRDNNFTAFRYDEYGRCHSHKWPSPFDIENFAA